MKAMILAAGLGKRMRPLTDRTPKPLLPVADKPLLQYHLEALKRAGIREVVINLAYLGEQIRRFVGDGGAFGLKVHYSEEPEPLETGGAILQALPLLGEAPFLLINGDVWTDYPLAQLLQPPLPDHTDGRLLMVPNPEFHPEGDFGLTEGQNLSLDEDLPQYTFAGISLLRPSLIADHPERRRIFPLLEALKPGIAAGTLEGRLHPGAWSDVGTPERLTQLRDQLENKPETDRP